jgi:predicted glycogen debranching enzyme
MYYFLNQNFEEIAQKEWLVTNGLGGYASSSLTGANSRRYHGLLVAAFNPPTDRRVLVSKIEESVFVGNEMAELSSNTYGSVVHPQGWQHLVSFERLPIPRWIYQFNEQTIAKTIFMPQGENSTVVSYQNTGNLPVTLHLNPLYVHRDYHSLSSENGFYNYFIEQAKNHLKIYPHYGSEPVYFGFSMGEFVENRNWYKNFTYQHEQERGLDFQEDAYSIGYLEITLEAGEECFLTFSTDAKILAESPSELRLQEIERINALKETQKDSFLQDLVVSANQFIVQRKSTQSESIIAGYHWFTDWGRDTMIALRGLCISLGHQQTAKRILTTFFNYLDDGMLPNRFPDNSQDPIEYNTIDATLWLFVALYEYHQKFTDIAFVEKHFEQLTNILDAHKNGTRYGIHVTEEGLLAGGKGNVQLTWMDARVGDYVVTPRHGCPVEVNALWYNALKITIFFGKELNKKTDFYNLQLRKFEQNFKAKFWNNAGYLNDVVSLNNDVDTSIRPNQIYAVSLPFPLLSEVEQAQILENVREHLYTPLGLRTLSPKDPAFRPTYGGDQWQRDTAYHQGTVWPFLLGEYWQAYLRVNKFSKKAKTEMLKSLEAVKTHFYQNDCLLGISEIFDGLDPKQGKGTANQAWSVGAIVKLLSENGE